MKKLFSLLLILTIFVNYCPCFVLELSAKAKKPAANAGGKTSNTKASSISLKARDGGNIVYGSVLNSRENEVKAKLTPKQLSTIRKTGLENVSVSLAKVAKVGEVSTTYTLQASDSLILVGKQLVINLVSSLIDSAGSTYTAGALPEGTYQLTITAGDKTINGTFDYKPPTVLVGNVSGKSGTCTGGTQQVKDIAGQSLSRTVALSDCSYLNEVQASRVTVAKKSRTLLNQAIPGQSGAADSASTNISNEIAISEVTTPEGILKASVDLNPENNGKVKFDVDPTTTETVNSAQNLIAGSGTALTSDEKKILADALKSSVKPKSVEETESDIEAIGNSGSKNDFQFDPSCPSKFDALLNGVSSNSSNDELLALGKKLLAAIVDPSGIGKCIPPFVSKIIVDLVNTQGNIGLIAFAQKFIFHASEEQKQQQGPDPAVLCQHFKDDLKRMKTQCSQCLPPCIPDEMKNLLNKGGCPDVIALFDKCQGGQRACGIGGLTSTGGTTQPSIKAQIANNNDQGGGVCIQFKPPAYPCQPCDKVGDQCIPSKPIDNCSGKNFPSGTCKQVNDADGKPAVDDAGKPRLLCLLDSTSINTVTCTEDKFFDLNQQCIPAPANSCIIDQNTGEVLTNTIPGDGIHPAVQSNRFDKRCCGIVAGVPQGPNNFADNSHGRIAYQAAPTSSQGGGKHGRSLDTCIHQEICSNIDSNFESGPYGKVKQDVYNTILEKCKIEAGFTNSSSQPLRYCIFGEAQQPSLCQCAPGATNTGPHGSCQCTNGQVYTTDGCGTSTTHICLPSESPSISNCSCAPGATVKSGTVPFSDTTGTISPATCQCPSGQTYSVTGCSSSTSNHVCETGEIPTSANPCTCKGGTTTYNKACACPEGAGYVYTKNGCAIACKPNEAYSFTSNICSCASGATFNAQNICICPAGQTYTVNGCSSRICGSGESFNSTNPCTCASPATPTGAFSTCSCPNGVTYSSNGCDATTCTYSSYVYDSATKSCKCPTGTGPNPSDYKACIAYCATGQISTYTSRCACAGTATIVPNATFTESTCQCPAGQTYTSNGCGSSTTTPTPTTSTTPTATPTPSNRLCSPGENPYNGTCKCPPNAISSSTGCQCPSGQPAYTGVDCTPTCNVGQASTTSSPCSCIPPATANGPGGICQCPAGYSGTYLNGCGVITSQICAPNEASTSANVCTCAGTGVLTLTNTSVGPRNICQCPSGQTYTTSGCN